MASVRGFGVNDQLSSYMFRLLYLLGRAYTYLAKVCGDWFWQHYLLAYCRVKKEIELDDPKALRFSGRCLLSVGEGSNVHFGKDVVVNSGNHTIDPSPSKIYVLPGASLHMGENTGMSSVSIICKQEISIGSNVRIGAGCLILDSDMHSVDWRLRASKGNDIKNARCEPVSIGDYAFIGARSIILKGVHIGEKAVISAGSVVVDDIPANCMAGGNPCKVIKSLE